MEAHRVLTLREVAAYLQLGHRSVYRLAQRGDLPGRKVLGRWRFHQDDVDEWLRHSPAESRGDGGTAAGEADPSATTERTR